MDAQFWLDKWEAGETGFHRSRVLPWLEQYWPALDLPPDARVLVPLAGKSLDVAWLASRGHRVLAVELSPIAIREFFDTQGLVPHKHPVADGTLYQAANIDYLCGDIFGLDATRLDTVDACYDRAALVALPEQARARYITRLYQPLPPGTQILLITLDYPQEAMDGPPFAVPHDEVVYRFARHWHLQRLETEDLTRRDTTLAQRGLKRLTSTAYRLTRR